MIKKYKKFIIAVVAVVLLIATHSIVNGMDAKTAQLEEQAQIYNGQADIQRLEEKYSILEAKLEGTNEKLNTLLQKIDYEAKDLPEEYYYGEKP